MPRAEAVRQRVLGEVANAGAGSEAMMSFSTSPFNEITLLINVTAVDSVTSLVIQPYVLGNNNDVKYEMDDSALTITNPTVGGYAFVMKDITSRMQFEYTVAGTGTISFELRYEGRY